MCLKQVVKDWSSMTETQENIVVTAPQGPLQTKKARFNMPVWAKAWIALLPALIFLLLFTIYPILNTFSIAFIENFEFTRGSGSFAFTNFYRLYYNWEHQIGLEPPLVPPSFGLANFGFVLGDKEFLSSLINTGVLTLVGVPLTIVISLLIAVFLNSIKAMRGFYQTIFFLPYVTNSIALGMVFGVMFGPDSSGLMNQFLGWFGVQPQAWLDAGFSSPGILPSTRLSQATAIIFSTIWNGLAFKILVFMSGLASIDKQYYDAARIDGSSRWTIFRKITVPLLSPQILYITITSFIGSFKMYTGVMSLFGNPGANNGAGDFGGASTTEWLTVVGYIYKKRQLNLPYAAAGSVVLLVLILIITAVQMQVSKRRVHY